MTRLHTVTITGADDDVSHADLSALSRDFPFVEWGILLSRTRAGTSRYPSLDWLLRLSDYGRYALHLCGSIQRDMVKDKLFMKWLTVFSRVQLNGYEPLARPDSFCERAWASNVGWILQAPRLTKLVLSDAQKIGASVLYDPSGGTGRGPGEGWPRGPEGVRVGYAGGINPDNVSLVVFMIEAVDPPEPYWIDMESGVRTDDKFDLAKVRRVLEICAPLVAR